MTHAALYMRISADKTGQEAGVERQEAECREFALRLGYDIGPVLVDNDVSAHSGRLRPSFQKLLKLVEAGAVSTIIVWHTDRLYRRLVDLEPLIAVTDEFPVTIKPVHAGELDLNTASGRMNARILASVGAHEVEHMIERQKASYKARASAGEWHWARRPFGYDRGSDGRTVIVPAEAVVVAEVFARYYEDGTSRHALVRDLNVRGLTTPGGRPWAVATVRDMLRNPHYAGHATYRGEIVGQGNWEPIVDPDDFDRWMRSKVPGKNTFTRSATSLLSGLATCGVCGGVAYRARRSERDSWDLRCHEKQCVSVSARIAEDLIRSEVIGALLVGPSEALPIDEQGTSLHSLQEALDGLTLRRQELLDLMGAGLAPLSQIRPQLESIKADEEGLLQRRDELAATNAAAHMLVGIKKSLIGPDHRVSLAESAAVKMALGVKFDAMALDRQRELVRLLVDIRIHPGRGAERIEITHKLVVSMNE